MSGDVTPSVTRSFASADEIDFSSSAGIQQLLSVVRNTPMSRSDYNNLRDLIFSYKSQGDAPAAKEQILSELRELGLLADSSTMPAKSEPATTDLPDPAVNPVKIKKIEETSPTTPAATITTDPSSVKKSVGSARPKPAFGASGAVAPTPTPTKSAPISVPVADVAEPASVEPAPKVDEKPVVDATKEADNIVDTPAEVSVSTGVTEPTVPDVVSDTPAEETAELPTADEKPSATNTPTAVGGVSYGDPLERIKQIKREVNTLVGNPINLIDSNNEIGREYMNALLDAMKKVNSGVTTEINTAMQRLEAAFTQVKTITPATAAANDTAVENKVPDQVVVEETSEISSPQAVEPEPAAEPVTETPTETVLEPEPEVETTQFETNNDQPLPLNTDKLKEPLEIKPVKEVIPNAGLPKSSLFSAPEPAPEDKPQADPEPVAQNTTTSNQPASISPVGNKGLNSVAEDKEALAENVEHAMQEAASLKMQREAEIAQMDPVMTPDVTNGLNQLLSEWKLFKSSGIFGTGPSGVEHPLYKKLAGLQMTAVITGRFEGATPEIKQSITDYMNGWRYEEGIIHEHGETFEHYLRRVIRKILDKRKPKN